MSEYSPRWQPTRNRIIRRSVAARSRADVDHLRLTTLVLDLGGVVVPTLFEVIEDPSFPAGPFGHDEMYKDVENGHLQERDYWAALAASRPDLDVAHLMRACLGIRDEVRGLLSMFAGRFKTAALTNDMAHWFGASWSAQFPEFGQFDVLLEAAQSGRLKPDPSVFRWALVALHEQPRNCLFVDDLPSNLAGARAVGMEVEHFDVSDPAGSVKRILKRFGITQTRGMTSRVYRPIR